MVKTRRITSLPRRLFYKTKRVIMTPVRKVRRTHNTTAGITNNRKRHSKSFGGFQRGHTKQTQPAHKKKGLHFLGFTIRKDPNYTNNHNHRRRHRTIKSKIRSLLH